MSKHAAPLTVRRRLADYLIPRPLPGKHLYNPIFDGAPDHPSCIIDRAAFTAMAARMYPTIGAKP